MLYLTKKIKSLLSGLLVLSFLMAVSLGSCTMEGSDSDDDGDVETTEQAEGTEEEHPAGGEEHPAASDEEEHPSDSTASGDEHPDSE